MPKIPRVVALVLLLSPVSPMVAAAPADFPDEAIATAAEVVDGTMLVLEQPVAGSRTLRLAAIEPPARASSGSGTGGPADVAARTLGELTSGHTLHLALEDRPMDRYGRILAQVERDDGLWLQGEMVASGLARVHTQADARSRARALLALESEARDERLGIWSDPFYRVRGAVDVGDAELDSFQIVEGRVVKATRVRDRVYLNFGPDWRTDFTVSIETDVLPAFEQADLDPLALRGRTIRVRGWVQPINGPLIDVTHPEQIEVIADAP